MSYLNLVEEYPKQVTMNQFEKVLVAARRAKDLYKGSKAPLVDSEHNPTYVALEEMKAGKIEKVYREADVAELLPRSTEESEEDDD